MINVVWRLMNKKFLIILFLALIASPLLGGYNSFAYCLIQSHYLTVYLNNLFLLFIYQLIYQINQMYYPVILRMGKKSFYFWCYILIIGCGLLYTLTIYISYFYFFGAIGESEKLLVYLFMIVNVCVCCIECSFIYMQLGHRKTFIYLALPIFINFLFHMMWIYYF